MKVSVDENLCTGCGTCTEICPEVFELTDDLAMVKIGNEEVPEQYENACQEAVDSCPVEAITVD